MSSVARVLDEARWGWGHWRLFAVVAANYFLDGVMFSIAPLLVYIVAAEYGALVFSLNLLAETAGAIVLGRLADIYGRRRMFMVSLALEVAALLLLFPLYENIVALAVLTSVMTFGIGGEFGAAYAAIAELVPARHRGKALMLATNFWNIGAAFIALVSLYASQLALEPRAQAEALLAASLGTAVVVGLARLGFPESPRWLLEKGRVEEALAVVEKLTGTRPRASGRETVEPREEKELGVVEAFRRYWFRFLVLAVITVAQYVTYDVTAYYVPYAPGYRFGPESVPVLVLVANAGASVGAFLLLPIIDRARRLSVALAFAGGLVTAAILYYAHNSLGVEAFYAALFVNLVFSEWAWASLSVLQSELFPTNVRASVVGVLTGLTGVSGAAVVYAAVAASVHVLFTVVLVLWGLGLAAAVAWYLWGVETARRPVEEIAA